MAGSFFTSEVSKLYRDRVFVPRVPTYVTTPTGSLQILAPEHTLAEIQGRMYKVDGVNLPGTNDPRPLSIAELFMVICLKRAVEMENRVINQMEELEQITDQLAALTEAEKVVVAEKEEGEIMISGYTLVTFKGVKVQLGDLLKDASGGSIAFISVYTIDDLINQIESLMDSKNSFTQEKMIQLQSDTNKRNQSYDMASNVVKSLFSVMSANVNNL